MPGTSTSGGRRSASKSRAQHERDGTFRKDRHADLKNPEPTPGRPDPPVELDKTAQDEWNRLMWAFDDMQMLHKVDAFAVYQHCQLYAETEDIAQSKANTDVAIERLEENLGDFKGEDFVKLIQELTTLRKLVAKCTDQLRQGRMAIRQYLVEFGLTPASRSRIKLPAKAPEVDAFTKFQQQRAS